MRGIRLDWGAWFLGIWSAFISGGAGAVVSGVVVSYKAPEKFGVGTSDFFQLIGSVFVVQGALTFFAYIAKHPAPDIITETTVSTTAIQENPQALVTTIVKKTETEPPKG